MVEINNIQNSEQVSRSKKRNKIEDQINVVEVRKKKRKTNHVKKRSEYYLSVRHIQKSHLPKRKHRSFRKDNDFDVIKEEIPKKSDFNPKNLENAEKIKEKKTKKKKSHLNLGHMYKSHIPERKKKKSERRGKSSDRRRKKKERQLSKPNTQQSINAESSQNPVEKNKNNKSRNEKLDSKKKSMRVSQTERVLKVHRKTKLKKEDEIHEESKPRKRKSVLKTPSEVVFKRKKESKGKIGSNNIPSSHSELTKPPVKINIRNGVKNSPKKGIKTNHLTPKSKSKIQGSNNNLTSKPNITSNRKKDSEMSTKITNNKSENQTALRNSNISKSRKESRISKNQIVKDSEKNKMLKKKSRKSKLSFREIPKPKEKNGGMRSSKRNIKIPKLNKNKKPFSKKNKVKKRSATKDSLFEGFSIESIHKGRQEEACNLLKVSDLLQYSGEAYSPSAALEMSEKQLNWEKMTFLELLKSDDLYFERRDGHTEELIRAMEAASPREKETISSFFCQYLPKTHKVQSDHTRFAKKMLKNELSKSLQKKRENDFLKRQMVESFGVIDFSDDMVFKNHFYEYNVEYGPDQAKVNKIRPAQVFLPEKQYEIYLLDLSVINR